MAFWNRSGVFLKTLLQLGVEGPALYGIYRLGLKTGHYRRLEDKLNQQTSAAAVTLRPAFDLPDRAQVSNALSDRDRASLLKVANEIIHGKVRLFGSKPVALQLRLRGPLRHWTDYERHEAARPITRSIAAHSGDLKFLWEPARFGWAFSLGRAYHVTRREKFADAFWKYFEEFDKGNPPYMGPHWMNGQEVAIRLMASSGARRCSPRRRHPHLGAEGAWRSPSLSMRGDSRPRLSMRVRRTTIISSPSRPRCTRPEPPSTTHRGGSLAGAG